MQKLKHSTDFLIDTIFFYVTVVLLGGVVTLTGIMLIGLFVDSMS